jgi:hypothetical protein
MKTKDYEFGVISRGRVLDETRDESGQTCLTATRGDTFELSIINHSDRRIMAVCSVDGLCVMTGELSDDGRLRGYIIKPGLEMTIPGWRLDDDHVAAFEFTETAKSYSAQMGRKNEKHGHLICEIYLEKAPEPAPKPPAEVAEVDEGIAFAPRPRNDQRALAAPAEDNSTRLSSAPASREMESMFDVECPPRRQKDCAVAG